MDAATGTVLFSKNGDKQFYPASITKLMTALLVAENCSLDDKVTFSATATTNLEAGAVSINMTAGDVMTVRQCLYALLLKSANEVGNALAEHVAGSNAKFAEMMNAKAAALGCTNTHFTNPHGLNDSNHYTTPHDMALIARAAFQNDVVKTVASTRTYTLPATIKESFRAYRDHWTQDAEPQRCQVLSGRYRRKDRLYVQSGKYPGDSSGKGRSQIDCRYHEEQIDSLYGYEGIVRLRI